MRKSNVIAAILSTASLVWFTPAHAGTKPKAESEAEELTLDYHLPEVKIGFAVSHMITACPNAQGVGFAMDTVTAIKPVYVRGAQIKVNPKGNLLVDREIKLEFHDNGTIKSFNASSTGQGGKIAAAVIKAATFAVTTAMGVPLALPVAAAAADGKPDFKPIQCKNEIVRLLSQKAGLETALTRLKQSLIDDGASKNLLMQITRTEAALADTLSRLTVSPDPAIWTPTAAIDPRSDTNLPSPTKADLTVWFEDLEEPALQAALDLVGYGQVLDFKASVASATGRDARPTPTTERRALIYRDPGAVTVKLEPRSAFSAGNLSEDEQPLALSAYEDTKAKATVKVPQIGTLKKIAFDGSGMFGSRAVAATFAQTGEVMSIGYTSTGGADALAGVVDAAVAAGIELRDQETNASKREVERRTQANALAALIEAEAEAKKEKEDAAVPAAAGS
ncbi:hypothetical protein [Blastomonas sp. SL216]|uniref:hypothetical protein n=1 Tax=Blastomonas sp. SL216 TaxID=2995169 RepID=UPI002376D952|nr:hypothetical protein OU999_08465 [Blastomonas sp. SL216]